MGSDFTMGLYHPKPIPKHASGRNSCHTPPKTGAVERKYVRCKKYFLVTNNEECLSSEQCFYHWAVSTLTLPAHPFTFDAKVSRLPRDVRPAEVTCMDWVLRRNERSSGGFRQDPPRENPSPEDRPDVYAIDCEMSFTAVILLVDVLCLARLSLLVNSSRSQP
ncbi:hypothetical protein J6590_074503 [Homalodisca vitripennis]|nr:hypothetical protein J6590_074503 [Homalodisca vitripennis]